MQNGKAAGPEHWGACPLCCPKGTREAGQLRRNQYLDWPQSYLVMSQLSREKSSTGDSVSVKDQFTQGSGAEADPSGAEAARAL